MTIINGECMKKNILLLVSSVVLFSVTGCSVNEKNKQETIEENGMDEQMTLDMLFYDDETFDEEETALLFSVKEIESDFDAENCKIALVNLNPCIVSDGKAYIYVDGCWNEVETDHDIVTVYNGDVFSALDSEGHIITIPEETDDYEGYPLTTAAAHYNAAELRKLAEDEKILLLSGDPLGSEHCVVYFENGDTSLFANGTAFPISDSIVVADILGNFILSEEGNVYKVVHTDNPEHVSLKQVSEGKYVEIAACTSADRCIGIRQDGTTTVWSDVDLGISFHANHAKSAAMGFNYGIILCEDGNVEFHSVDGALEYQVSEYLAKQKEDIIAISCSYNSIAMLNANGSVKIIDIN